MKLYSSPTASKPDQPEPAKKEEHFKRPPDHLLWKTKSLHTKSAEQRKQERPRLTLNIMPPPERQRFHQPPRKMTGSILESALLGLAHPDPTPSSSSGSSKSSNRTSSPKKSRFGEAGPSGFSSLSLSSSSSSISVLSSKPGHSSWHSNLSSKPGPSWQTAGPSRQAAPGQSSVWQASRLSATMTKQPSSLGCAKPSSSSSSRKPGQLWKSNDNADDLARCRPGPSGWKRK